MSDLQDTPAQARYREMKGIRDAIAERDYRALKAFKLGAPLEELYPGETAWYQAQLARLNELEAETGPA
ncbi:MAG: hypothetical protein LBQ35_07060 [Spirochaetaceae bacterium]|jgi:hypothetical protein|nr:hypothetical protein [Spirochaetaceae bacterium]